MKLFLVEKWGYTKNRGIWRIVEWKVYEISFHYYINLCPLWSKLSWKIFPGSTFSPECCNDVDDVAYKSTHSLKILWLHSFMNVKKKIPNKTRIKKISGVSFSVLYVNFVGFASSCYMFQCPNVQCVLISIWKHPK